MDETVRELQRLQLPGGSVALLASGGTERTFRVELDGRVFTAIWDPRETGTALLLDAQRWRSPADAPIATADWERVLDALWAMAPLSGGAHHVLEWDPASKCYVARRWDRSPDGFLATARGDDLDYLELGRTARVHGSWRYGVTPPIFGADPASARWIHPPDGPLDPSEWRRVSARLASAEKLDFFLASDAIKIQEAPRARG